MRIMIYKRIILTKLKRYINLKEIVIITGMRRVGKTTILKYLYDSIASNNKAILDIENPIVRSFFEEVDYDNIWNNLERAGLDKSKKAYIFLDRKSTRLNSS